MRAIASALRQIAEALDNEADASGEPQRTAGKPKKPRRRGPIGVRPLSPEEKARLDSMPPEERDALGERVEQAMQRGGFVLTPKGERERDARHARMRAREEAARKQQGTESPKQAKRKTTPSDD